MEVFVPEFLSREKGHQVENKIAPMYTPKVKYKISCDESRDIKKNNCSDAVDLSVPKISSSFKILLKFRNDPEDFEYVRAISTNYNLWKNGVP